MLVQDASIINTTKNEITGTSLPGKFDAALSTTTTTNDEYQICNPNSTNNISSNSSISTAKDSCSTPMVGSVPSDSNDTTLITNRLNQVLYITDQTPDNNKGSSISLSSSLSCSEEPLLSTTTTTSKISTSTTTLPSTLPHFSYGQYQPYKLRYTREQETIYNNSNQYSTKPTEESSSQISEHDTTSSTTTATIGTSTVIDPMHLQPMGTWTYKQIHDKKQQHSFACTWQCNSIRHTLLPYITHGRGIYLYTLEEEEEVSDEFNNETNRSPNIPQDKNVVQKRYIDWTSQAVCINLGHTIPQTIQNGIVQQLQNQTIPTYVYGGLGITEIRIRFNTFMNEYILPKPLVVAVCPSSGCEANEAGIILAQRYTKRTKVLSLYRSYHGASHSVSAITGDYRRWYNENNYNTSNNHIKIFHPFPYFFQHHGTTKDEQIISALHMLEEQIINENPYNIASIVMESIIGAGGCCIYPIKYIHGIRSICNKYGILLHFDEIMVGFGRTGKMFGFQHYEDNNDNDITNDITILPDIITCAKGLTSAYMPLSMMACRKDILDYFETTPLGWGSTYESHPLSLLTAYETMKYLVQESIIERVQFISKVFTSEMQRLAHCHPCIKQSRSIGLFGCLDVQDVNGYHPKIQGILPMNDDDKVYYDHLQMAYEKYIKAYAMNGLIGLHRFPHIHCAPPLIITEEELYDGFERLHQSLLVLDDALGFEK